jgi:threonine aldolase
MNAQVTDAAVPDEDFVGALRDALRGCARRMSGARVRTVREAIEALSGDAKVLTDELLDAPVDVYGDGLVAALERKVAELLGTEEAAYFPSGTMAQQAALRCWAIETGNDVVATHPLAHLEVHEEHAYRDLTSLRGVWPTNQARTPSADEVRAAERFGTLALELPLRDAGFLLPEWAELVETVGAARERDARVHFDGARLWETTSHFGRPLPEIAALADSVYVSFYKSLGAVSGAAVAGPAEFVGTLKHWRHRYGGQIFQQWPAVITALAGIEQQLPRLPEYAAHAKTVAAALAEAAKQVPGVRVFPEPPHTHQFRLWAPFDPRDLRRAAVQQIQSTGSALLGGWMPGPLPGHAFTEATVAADALAWSADEVTTTFLDLLERAARFASSS